MEFPKYVTGGLFLSGVNNKGVAEYRRPKLTGFWSLNAKIENNKVVCTDGSWGEKNGDVLNEITEEEFIKDNGGLPLQELLK